MFELPLPVPRSTHYARLGVGPEATTAELAGAQSRYRSRLEAEGADDEKIAEANAVDLADVAARAEYDQLHPPLALLRLERPMVPMFHERAAMLAVVRRSLQDFFAARGIEVRPPSDLSRRDFTADFSYAELLDGRGRGRT